jgi:predicted O-methyltransferase YrrM
MTILEKSLQDNIPIVRKNTIQYIIDLISKNNYSTILEIGTAYGYSSDKISTIPCVNKIVTIERDLNRFNTASYFLKNNKKIVILNEDAFYFNTMESFDFIFIDGPKSNQEILVEKYYQYLNVGGTMVIDNIFLKKFNDVTNLTKNQSNLVDKVKKFET